MHSFIFTGPRGTITAHGVDQYWSSTDQAQQSSTLVVGALPFHKDEQPLLFSPTSYTITDELMELSSSPLPAVTKVEFFPSISQHVKNVAASIAEIHAGVVEKIVLSRSERYHLAGYLHPESMLAMFMKKAGTGCGYLLQVTPKEFFIGPSPEVLIHKQEEKIFSFPLAGTMARASDLIADQKIAEDLQNSVKDLHEHRFVVDGIKKTLAPLCSELSVSEQPSLLKTAHTWHLGTPIHGKLKDPSISSLALAKLLHPTAAVNGYPADIAARLLKEREPNRGFYSGAVGWNLPSGDGEWRVAIRSALITDSHVTAFAGGGIVASSVAEDELQETHAKLGVVRNVLGLDKLDVISC